MDCTGPENVILRDIDGKFGNTGKTHTMISMNEGLGDNLDKCEKNIDGNNYICERDDLAVVEF